MSDDQRYYAVDLDSTLMYHEDHQEHEFGEPIQPMLVRVKEWLAAGHLVKIFTARAFNWETQFPGQIKQRLYERDIVPIRAWCVEHIGIALQVTCMKSPHLIELWDDRAVRVAKNLGFPVRYKEPTPETLVSEPGVQEQRLAHEW